MILELNKIKRSMHADVIASFWTMMQTIETLAEDEDDPILKVQVEGFYKQWNRMTGATQKPRWLRGDDLPPVRANAAGDRFDAFGGLFPQPEQENRNADCAQS